MGNQTEPYDPILFSCIFLALHGDGEVSQEEDDMLSKIAQSLHAEEGTDVLESTISAFNKMSAEERTKVVMETSERTSNLKPEIRQFIASMLGQVAFADNEITEVEEAILSWFGIELAKEEPQEKKEKEKLKKQVEKPKSQKEEKGKEPAGKAKSKKEEKVVENRPAKIEKTGQRTELNSLSDYLNHSNNNFSGNKYKEVKKLLEHLEEIIEEELPETIFKYSPSGISLYADSGGRSKIAGIFINKALAQIVLIRDHRHEYRKPIVNGIKAINRANKLGWIDWYKLELSSAHEFVKNEEKVIQLFRESLEMKMKYPTKILKEKNFTRKNASLLTKYLDPDYTYVVEGLQQTKSETDGKDIEYDAIIFSCIYLTVYGDEGSDTSQIDFNNLIEFVQELHGSEGKEVFDVALKVFNDLNNKDRANVITRVAEAIKEMDEESKKSIITNLVKAAMLNGVMSKAKADILERFGIRIEHNLEKSQKKITSKALQKSEEITAAILLGCLCASNSIDGNISKSEISTLLEKAESSNPGRGEEILTNVISVFNQMSAIEREEYLVKQQKLSSSTYTEAEKNQQRTELNSLSDYLNHPKNNFSGKKFDVVKLLIEYLENTIRKEFPSVIFKYSPSGISIYADSGGRSKFAGIFINKALAQIVLIRDHRHEYRKPIINRIKAINRVNDLGWIGWYKLELSSTKEFEKSKEQVIQLFRESLDMKVKFPANILKEKTFTAKKASLLSKYLDPDYTYVVEGETTADKNPNAEQDQVNKYTLWFYAWIGEMNEIDFEDPTVYFEKKFATLEDAKDFFKGYYSIKWDEGEWDGYWITISFKKSPLIEGDEEVVSECRITDWEDYEYEWFDKTGDSKDKVEEPTDEKGYPTLQINLLNKPTIDKRRKQYTSKRIEPSVFFNLREIKVNIPSWFDQFDNDNCCPEWSKEILDKISSTIEKKKIIPILEYVPKILFDHLEQPWWICPLAVFNAQEASALIVSNSGLHSLVPGDDDITWIYGWDQVRKMELTESFNKEENLVCLEIIDPDNEKFSIVEFVKPERGSYLKVLYSIYNVFKSVIEASEGKDSWQYYAGNETYMGFESVGELENDLGK